MKYEYIAIIFVIGLVYLILLKLSSIAASLRNIDRVVNHLSMQVGVVNERLHDIRTSVDDCKWDVDKIKDATEELKNHQLYKE